MYNLSAYFPAYGYYPPQRHQTYTPVAIDFGAAIRDSDSNPIFSQAKGEYKPRYHMKVSVPRSNRRGLQQHIPDAVVIPISADGIFRYQFAPTNTYYPFTRYVVEFYRYKNSVPLDIQEWLVPPIPKSRTYTFSYEQGVLDYELPYPVWSVLTLSPTAEYVSNYNLLSFIAGVEFLDGQLLTVTYQPAVTLDQILEYSFDNLNGLTRIRG